MINNLVDIYPLKDFKTCAKAKPQKIMNISEEYRQIYSLLKKAPIDINSLAEKLNIPLSELQGKLFMMELDNLAIQMSPGYYVCGK